LSKAGKAGRIARTGEFSLNKVIIMFLPKVGALDIAVSDAAENARLRLAIAEMASRYGSGAAFLGGVAYFLGGAERVGFVWIAMAGVLVTARWLFKNQRISFRAWNFASIIPLLGASFFSVLLLGGVLHSSAVYIWAFMVPMLILLTLGFQESRIIFTIYFILLIVPVFIPAEMLPKPPLTEKVEVGLFLFNLGAASLLIRFMFDFFVQERERLQKETDRLLLNILPAEVAAKLKAEPGVIATGFENVSILFADLVNFTPISAQLLPVDVVQMLNEVFSAFDKLVEKHGVEKIKTIGDCYMAAAGIPHERPDHAEALASMALEMLDYVEGHQFYQHHLKIRIGMNSGPAVAGVIGQKKFSYDIWGDTVNSASRMQSHASPGSIQITKATHDLIAEKFTCERLEKIEVKGKGKMEVWRLVSRKKGPID
jgi:adenylate cyclase